MTPQSLSQVSLMFLIKITEMSVNFPVGMVPSGWQVMVWVLFWELPDSAAGSVQT